MQKSDFPQFQKALARMFALYPSASTNETTFAAWFSYLAAYEIGLVAMALDKAMDGSPEFIPTAPRVREHCQSIAKTNWARPNLDLPALPEAEVELPDGHPMKAELDALKAKIRSGELSGAAAAKAVTAAVMGAMR